MELYWRVTYTDSTTFFQQFDGARYEDIDRTKLLFFDLLDSSTDRLVIRIHFDDPRKRLIYRRRTVLPTGGTPQVLFLAGWQMTVKGENIQSIVYVMESGEIFVSGGWKEPFGVPNIRAQEK